MKKLVVFFTAVGILAGAVIQAHALQFCPDYPFGGAAPSGVPYATIINETTRPVLISMSSEPLSGERFIRTWRSSVGLANPAEQLFGQVSGVAAAVGAGADAFKADGGGDGMYDAAEHMQATAQGSEWLGRQ